MKTILITQRVEHIKSRNEIRDSLDRRWIKLLLSLELLPIIIPNNAEYIDCLLTETDLLRNSCGLIISGGEDDCLRNKIEIKLLEWAIKANKPVLGVCHGMQLIQNYYNNPVYKIDNHINIEHNIITSNHVKSNINIKEFKRETMYHQYGTDITVKPLETLAKSSDGIIIAIKHYRYHLYGIMWHPERSLHRKSQQQLLRDIF